jgi:hypothetical protein
VNRSIVVSDSGVYRQTALLVAGNGFVAEHVADTVAVAVAARNKVL